MQLAEATAARTASLWQGRAKAGNTQHNQEFPTIAYEECHKARGLNKIAEALDNEVTCLQ